MAGRFQECLAEIRNAAGEDVIDSEQAQELLDRIERRVRKRLNAGNLEALDRIVMEEAGKLADAEELNAMVEKRNAFINAFVERNINEFLSKYKDPAEGITALLGGVVHLRDSGRFSVDAQGKANIVGYMQKLINRLDNKDKDWQMFISGTMEKEIANELWQLSLGDEGKPGITGSLRAKRIAEAVRDVQLEMINRQNRAGAFIGQLKGYVTRQTHDMDAVRRAGGAKDIETAYQNWKSFIVPLLDHEATFEDKDAEKVLRGAFEGIVSGVHLRSSAENMDDRSVMFQFTGPKNLAKRLSQPRLLKFKDAESWLQYNTEFGTKQLHESVLQNIEFSGRNMALLENLGTNPQMMFQRIKEKHIKEGRMDFKTLDKLRGVHLDNIFKELDGTTRIPVNVHTARIGAGIRMVQNMAKLGGIVLSSLGDMGSIAGELRYQGIPLLRAYSQLFGGLFRGRGDEETKQIARSIGVAMEGILGEVVQRFSSHDSLPGRMSRMQQAFFKWTGSNWWNDTHRTTMGLVMSNHLAEMADTPFEKLDEYTQRLFHQYGIKEHHWDAFRGTRFTAENGYRYLTPDNLRGLSDETLTKMMAADGVKFTEANKNRYLDKAETMWRSYFVDRADFAVPTPGAYERALVNAGTQPGSALGEAVRFVMQFKQFPFTMTRRGIGRELYGYGANSLKDALFKGQASYAGMAHMIAAMTVFGMFAAWSKDIVAGKTPRPLVKQDGSIDPKFFFRALAQGGGFGIYGDYLFGEFSRYGRSAVSTLAGPTFSQFDDVAELWTRFRNGDDVAANVFRLIMNNTPFINLFYTRAALDYTVLYQMQEMINPGFLTRMESRIKRENNQTFMFPPSQAIPYGGGNRLFEGIRK